VKCKKNVRSAAFHPNGETFALGLTDGSVELYETESLTQKHSKKIPE